jgi:hypothetical protein
MVVPVSRLLKSKWKNRPRNTITVRLFLPPVEYERVTSAASNGVMPILPRTRSSDP